MKKINIGAGHVITAMHFARFGDAEISAMEAAMKTGDFSNINFCKDIYTKDRIDNHEFNDPV